LPTQQGAQGWQAHGVKGTQGHFVARQLRQGIRHLAHGFAAQALDGIGHRVLPRLAGVKHTVDGQALVG